MQIQKVIFCENFKSESRVSVHKQISRVLISDVVKEQVKSKGKDVPVLN